MDGVSLDQLLGEIAPSLTGRHLGRPRLVGPNAVAFEVSGDRQRWLWLEAGRRAAGLYRLDRERARRLAQGTDDDAPGRSRQALLLLRKHLEGARVGGLHRVPGERTLVLGCGEAVLVLRLGGSAPALTLLLDGVALGTVGEGPEVPGLPEPRPERDLLRIEPAAFASAVTAAEASGLSRLRSILRACPSLGPALARQLDGGALSLAALQARVADPRPTLSAPGPYETWHDLDLVALDAVALAPLPVAIPGRVTLSFPTWQEAAERALEAAVRGARFEGGRRSVLETSRRRQRRLTQLAAHLEKDLAGMPDTGRLRREGEALLAAAGPLPPGAEWIEIPDPYASESRLRIRIDRRLSVPANADRVFDKARRIDRARGQVEARLRETRVALEAERAAEDRAQGARDLEELDASPREKRTAPEPGAGGGPRQFLTSRGLTLLIGRGARENHHLTFGVAGPEDVWLHAREVPGAHVILRDNEGRAGVDDFREAAEVAAFFSNAREESKVDVHVTRRKHLRPARGGPGRVIVGHSETLRVRPLDPEGRLRRR